MLYLFRRWLSDKMVAKIYRKWGEQYGDALSYGYMGKCIGFDALEAKWKKWRDEYVSRGYVEVPVESFVDAGGYGMDIAHKFFVRPEQVVGSLAKRNGKPTTILHQNLKL